MADERQCGTGAKQPRLWGTGAKRPQQPNIPPPPEILLAQLVALDPEVGNEDYFNEGSGAWEYYIYIYFFFLHYTLK